MILDAWGWCTEMTQRDGTGREKGGEFRMGNTCIHMFPIVNSLPPPSPSHPSGSSQCTSPKHPVSCIKPRMVIRILHDSIHASMPFSQIIPPFPSPTESKILFYTSVSLLLSCIQGYHYHLSKFHIYVLVYCIGVFLSGLFHSVQSAPVSSTSLELIQMYSF